MYINKGVAKDAIVKGLYIQCPGVKKSQSSGSFSHFTSSFEPQRGVRLNINVNANLIRFIVRTQFKTNSISISCSWTISYVKQRDRTQTKGCEFFVQNFFLAIMHALLIYIDWRRIRIFNYNSLCVVNFQCLIYSVNLSKNIMLTCQTCPFLTSLTYLTFLLKILLAC